MRNFGNVIGLVSSHSILLGAFLAQGTQRDVASLNNATLGCLWSIWLWEGIGAQLIEPNVLPLGGYEQTGRFQTFAQSES